MKPQSLDSLFSTWRLYAFMLVDLCLWAFRLLADLFLDTIGLLHLPQRGRIPPVTDPLLMQPATVLTERIRKGEVCSSLWCPLLFVCLFVHLLTLLNFCR